MLVRIIRTLATLAIIVPLGGCLVKDTTHTLYLSREGSVTWLVVEKDIMSLEDSPVERQREEMEFLQRVATASHDVGLALGQLAPADLRSLVVRDMRPYAVLTEARFDTIDRLGGRLLDRLGLKGRSTLVAEGELVRWRLEADIRAEAENRDEALTALAENIGRYRIVLPEGRFVSLVGFRSVDDGHAAVMIEADLDALVASGQPLVFELAWR